MKDYEQLGRFFLGHKHDLDLGETGTDPILYDAGDLTTHAVCVGMTGSGKTGLGIPGLRRAIQARSSCPRHAEAPEHRHGVRLRGDGRAVLLRDGVCRWHLKAPAVGLVVASALDVVATLGILLFSLRISAVASDALTIRTLIFNAVGVASLTHGIVLALGAAKMFRLRSYPIAVGASVVAVLPFGPGAAISLPFGIWALIVLLTGETRAAFAAGSGRDIS